MAISEEAVREALKQVVDPELFVNIVDLGLIYSVTVAPSQRQADSGAPAGEASSAAEPTDDVFIEMTMTSPACPAGPQLIANSKQAVARLEGVGNVEVKLVMSPPWTPDMMTDAARDQLGIF
jgi:metal-sulfur cluster biosynthetic enzyme